MEHEAERIRQQRAELAEHDQLKAELEAAGYQVADNPAGPDQLLANLLHDDEDLTAEAHATCPGRAVFFRPWDLHSPVHYCTDPAAYGHTSRYASSVAGAPDGDGEPDLGAAATEALPDPSRRLVIEGNKAWAAATEVRRRWLATLFARRTAPRELTQFVTSQLITMPEPVCSGLGRAHRQPLFGQVTGRSDTDWLTLSETAPAGRLPLVMFAPIATAFESAMGEGEGRNTWRTGRYSPCPHEQAAAYLTLLAGLGYQLSVIEQAAARLQPYTGETPPGQAIIGQDSDPAQDTDGTGPGTAEGGQPDVGQGVSGDEAGAADDGVAEAPIAA